MVFDLVIVDAAAAINELFAELLATRLEIDVVAVATVGELEQRLSCGERYRCALVELSFPEERRNGLDALFALRQTDPSTTLAILSQHDPHLTDLLRDAWETMPIATVVAKTAPIMFQLAQIAELLRTGSAPVDPAVATLLPPRPAHRRPDQFARLVAHAGHAKLWAALFEANGRLDYQELAAATGLRINTIKNYRAQLLPELANHGLDNPSLIEMTAFARRCRPLLAPFVDASLARRTLSRHAPVPS